MTESAPTGRRRRSRRGILLRLVAAFVVVVAAYLGITFVLVYRASDHDGVRHADAIVVLGAAQYDGRPSPVLKRRLDHALELYEAGYAPMVVVTGGRQEGDRFTEATAGYNYLRDRGVADEALLKEVQGKSSYESLAASARLLVERGFDDVVLVTDGYHAFRVRAIAEDLGLHAAVSPAGGSGGREMGKILRETAAVSVGRIIGWDRLFRINTAVSE